MMRSKDETAYATLLAAPAAILFTAVAVYPIGYAVWLSLRRKILVFHEDRFVGLANYRFLVRDQRFLGALANTVYFTVVSVALEVALGLAFAMLLEGRGRGRGWLRVSMLVPWAIPSVVSAKIWAWLYNPDYGVVARLLPSQDIDILGTPGWAMHGAILADVWKTTPFVALLLLAALTSVPAELYLAARVDGASPARVFRSITLPLIAPALAAAVVFRSLDAMRIFDAIFVLTGGGPANTTETLSIYAYKTLMRLGDFGYGSTLSTATFVVTALVAALCLTATGRDQRGRR